MRILSWNILHGGGSRWRQILEVIEGHRPDLVTLQEFRPAGDQDELLKGLGGLGLAHQFVSPTGAPRANGLMIAARLPFDARPFPSGSTGTVHCIQAELERGPYAALDLIAVHFPQKEAQVPLFDALLDLPAGFRRGAALLVGDFNCGIPFEDSDTRTFYATHLFQQLLRQGWVDAWRSRHRRAREFSWVSHRGNGFRYDHALASPALDRRILSVSYDHEVRDSGCSDHSALLVDTDLDRPSGAG